MSDATMEPGYRDTHSLYIQLTDNLLSAHLVQAAPSLQPDPLTGFYNTCRDLASSPEVASPVIRQLLAMSDFNCFQMMMVTRNAELDISAIDRGVGDGTSWSHVGSETNFDEDEQLRQALQLSIHDGGGEAVTQQQNTGASNADDAEMRHAMAVSGDVLRREVELRAQRDALEQAHLAAALAQSLASSAATQIEHERSRSRAQEKARARQRTSEAQVQHARAMEQEAALEREREALRSEAATELARQQRVWETTLAAERQSLQQAEEAKRQELEQALVATQTELEQMASEECESE